MSLRVYVEGQREDVERFFNEIIYPEFGRLREDERFRVTENKSQYIERNKTTGAVERLIRGYSPVLKYRNRPGLWEKYVVEDVEPKEGLGKVSDVQVKVHLRSDDPSEVKLFYDEFIEPKGDQFVIEKDTGLYLNRRRYGSRIFGGHFKEAD